jgi:hypothetical protein
MNLEDRIAALEALVAELRETLLVVMTEIRHLKRRK